MKKSVALVLIMAMLVCALPLSASAYRIGDTVGYALSTDIAATINGYDIPSYNVDGYTYIVVEDLRHYGFTVNYDNTSRSLSVSRDYGQAYPSKSYTKTVVPSGKLGKRAHSLLYTDITTDLDGIYTASYNINGQTIIRFDALSAYGGVSYDDSRREISLDLSGLNYNPLSHYVTYYGAEFEDTFENEYAKNGLSAACRVRATSDTIYFNVAFNDISKISSADSDLIVSQNNESLTSLKQVYSEYRKIYPTLAYININILDKNGSEIYSTNLSLK